MGLSDISNPALEDVSRIFDALGDASRLKLLRALMEAGRPLCQRELAAATGLSQANTSKHLACLVKTGILVREPKGNRVFFRVVAPMVEELCDRVCTSVTNRIQDAFRALS